MNMKKCFHYIFATYHYVDTFVKQPLLSVKNQKKKTNRVFALLRCGSLLNDRNCKYD